MDKKRPAHLFSVPAGFWKVRHLEEVGATLTDEVERGVGLQLDTLVDLALELIALEATDAGHAILHVQVGAGVQGDAHHTFPFDDFVVFEERIEIRRELPHADVQQALQSELDDGHLGSVLGEDLLGLLLGGNLDGLDASVDEPLGPEALALIIAVEAFLAGAVHEDVALGGELFGHQAGCDILRRDDEGLPRGPGERALTVDLLAAALAGHPAEAGDDCASVGHVDLDDHERDVGSEFTDAFEGGSSSLGHWWLLEKG